MNADPFLSAQRLPSAGVAASQRSPARGPLRMQDLPKPLLCIPLVAQWFWLAARHGSLTLPSCINPAIETGGLAGESKSSCLAQIAPDFSANIAPWYRVGAQDDALALRRTYEFTYPLIAKPDIGWCGYGVRRIENDAELAAYAAAFPRESAFIVQHLVQAPHEAGLFYVREPGAAGGQIVAMTLRHAPHVLGDGCRTVAALLAADALASTHSSRFGATFRAAGLARVPAFGERVVLTTVASLRVGATYEDASPRISANLEARLDAIALSMGDFHLGRFDVRFESMAALQAGEFSIIEVNGAGSEAIHFWDPGLSVWAAFAGVFAKQKLLFKIGAAMRKRGHKPVGVIGLAQAWLRQQSLIGRYPPSN